MEFEQTVNLALALEPAKKENNEEFDHNASDNVNRISYNKKNQNNHPRFNNLNNSSAPNLHSKDNRSTRNNHDAHDNYANHTKFRRNNDNFHRGDPPHSKPKTRFPPGLLKKLGISDLCLTCGRNNHTTDECRSKSKLTCNLSGNKRHLAKVCVKALSEKLSIKSVNIAEYDSDYEFPVHQMTTETSPIEEDLSLIHI